MSDAGRPQPADPRTNTAVKVVLRAGLGLSLSLLAVGLVVQLASGHHRADRVRMFALFAAPTAGGKILAVGTLVLALTPAVGVLTVVGSWVRERDRVFVGVGAAVVAVLAAAVAVGALH